MNTASKRNSIEGKSLTPATNDNLAQLVGQTVTLIHWGQVVRRTIEVDTRVPGVERYVAQARTHRTVILPTDIIVG